MSVDDVVGVIAERLRRRFPDGVPGADAAAVGDDAADWLIAHLAPSVETTAVGRRIGPVYSTADLARWLPAPGSDALTTQAIRKRAGSGELVGFLTDDRQWAFPAWQFDRVAGRLRVRREVVRLWEQLPHGSWMTDTDLAAWMNSELRSLDGTPASYAHLRGAGDESLRHAVSRLRARAAA